MSALSSVVSVAQRYAELSNIHDLGVHTRPPLIVNEIFAIEWSLADAISLMVAPDALIYGNQGRDKIIAGMRAFRQRYRHVFWVFHHFGSSDASRCARDPPTTPHSFMRTPRTCGGLP